MGTHELGSYEYKCPDCKKGEELIFKELRGASIIFYCCFCLRQFSVKDQESGYIHRKVLSLKTRYPDRLKARNNNTRQIHSRKTRAHS